MIVLGNKLEEWGIVTEVNEGTPEVDYKEAYVPGSSVPIDYTEALTGEPTYKPREMTIKLSFVEEDLREAKSKLTEIKNKLHGKAGDIILDDELSFVYKGRVFVEAERIDPKRVDIELNIIAHPYKYLLEDTVVRRTIAGTETLNLKNLRKKTIPTITVDSQFDVEWNRRVSTIQAGTHVLDIVLEQGDNFVKVTGNGKISFTYREGCL